MGKELVVYDATDTLAKTHRVLQSSKSFNRCFYFGIGAFYLIIVATTAAGLIEHVYFGRPTTWKHVLVIGLFLGAGLLVCFGLMKLANVFANNLNLLCPHCETPIDAGASWYCSVCSHHMVSESDMLLRTFTLRPVFSPIVGHCFSCGSISPAFRCPHCHETIVTHPNEHHNHKHRIARFVNDIGDSADSSVGASPSASPLDEDLR